MKKEAKKCLLFTKIKLFIENIGFILPLLISIGIALYAYFKYEPKDTNDIIIYSVLFGSLVLITLFIYIIFIVKRLSWRSNYQKRIAPSIITVIFTLGITGVFFYYLDIIYEFVIKFVNNSKTYFICLISGIVVLISFVIMVLVIKNYNKNKGNVHYAAYKVNTLMKKKYDRYKKKYPNMNITYLEFYNIFKEYKIYSAYPIK